MQYWQCIIPSYHGADGGGRHYPVDMSDFALNPSHVSVLDWIERGGQLVIVLDMEQADAEAMAAAQDTRHAAEIVSVDAVDEFVWRDVRARRDALIQDADWMVMRHMQEQELVTAGALTSATLTDGEYIELLEYIQTLRRIPQGYDYPAAVVWPTPPDCVS